MKDNASARDEINIELNQKSNQEISDAILANDSKLEYTLVATLRDKDGNIKQEEKVHNTVTTAGKNMIADRLLASPSLGVPTHMAIGTGTPSGTALGTELDRNALTSKSRSNAVVTMVGDWSAGDGTGAITEAGIFDASSSGNMHVSSSFSVINKGASDTLSISWTLTIS